MTLFNKDCRGCGATLDETNTHPKQKESYDYECRECKRIRNKTNREKRGEDWLNYRRNYAKKRRRENRCYNLRNTYGINLEEWESLFKLQGSVCKICKTPKEPSMGWHTDHCHTTGKVRGILCHNCNTGLGKFLDDPKLLRLAVNYLENNN